MVVDWTCKYLSIYPSCNALFKFKTSKNHFGGTTPPNLTQFDANGNNFENEALILARLCYHGKHGCLLGRRVLAGIPGCSMHKYDVLQGAQCRSELFETLSLHIHITIRIMTLMLVQGHMSIRKVQMQVVFSH